MADDHEVMRLSSNYLRGHIEASGVKFRGDMSRAVGALEGTVKNMTDQ
jgi:hypothetical protein